MADLIIHTMFYLANHMQLKPNADEEMHHTVRKFYKLISTWVQVCSQNRDDARVEHGHTMSVRTSVQNAEAIMRVWVHDNQESSSFL